MKKEEQLKIYSAYLPYGLKFISNDVALLKNAWTMIGIKSEEKVYGFSDTILSQRSDYKNIINISAKTIKPILYDLSYLTKEIEHEGERIVAIVEIMNSGFDHLEDMLIRIAAGLSNPDKLPYSVFTKLIFYHFNVFQLPESEFINKATLTNK